MKHLLTTLCSFALLSMSAQVPGYVPEDGLVAWYPFDGNADDESGNGNNGIVNGATLTADRFAEPNSAYYFDGASYIEVANSPSINIPTGEDISWSVWLITEVHTSPGSAFEKWDNSAGTSYSQLMLRRNASGDFFDSAGYCANPEQVGTGLVQTEASEGIWSHLALVTSNLETQLYFNGELVSASIIEDIGCSNSNVLHIGHRAGSSGRYYKGKIDDFAIWNRALSEAEIAGLFLSSTATTGCTDSTACNYNADSNYDDGSCTYPGCSDPFACNYNSAVGCDDGSCLILPEVNLGDTISFCDSGVVAIPHEFNFVSWSDGDTSHTRYFHESTSISVSWAVSEEYPSPHDFEHIVDIDSTSFWLSNFNADWPSANSLSTSLGGHLATFSSSAEMTTICNALPNNTDALFGLYQDVNSPLYSEPSGGWKWVTNEPLSWTSWYFNEPNNHTIGEEAGHLRPDCSWNDTPMEHAEFPFLVELPLSNFTCTNQAELTIQKLAAGCTDSLSCNYDLDALCDDGSCIYAATYHTCDGQCISDADGDGVCDELEVAGCSDNTACNYSSLVTDEDGSCVYATVIFDCDGNCQSDADGDGICDEYETMCDASYNLGYNEGLQAGMTQCLNAQCGPGTIWDPNYELCMPVEQCVGDLNGDSYIGTVDLLILLSGYASQCE